VGCAKRRELRTLIGHTDRITSVVVTPDGNSAVSGSADATLMIGDLASGHVHILRGHSGPVLAVGLTPNGRFIVSASDDGSIMCWEFVREKEPSRRS
jgi:WD40 repeat protein